MRIINYRKNFVFSIGHVIFILALVAFTSGCAEVPVTKRQGLHLVPRSELLGMSLRQYDEVIKKSRLSTDQAKVRMVRNIGIRIAGSAEAFLQDSGRGDLIKNYQWEFNLIEDDKTVNAWCLPGGKIVVYTGILPYTKDEKGLAVVIGHEVAHALADHGNERMSQALLANMGGTALSVALANKPRQTRDLFMAAFGAGANVGLILPYSRLHENEADRIGLILMARAGYDPREAPLFWDRMTKKGGPQPPELLSTHPSHETRIAKLREHMPEALQYYQKPGM
jgi:predicted Zn-dependent protease